jgi:archaellum biogenesis ATPase FlaH
MSIGLPAQHSYFLPTAQYLISIGLCPVLLMGKKPVFTTYTDYLPGPPGKDEMALPVERRPLRYSGVLLAAWEAEYPGANIGMLTRDRPCIDVDDVRVWDAIRDLVPPTPHIKRGARGFTLVYSVHPTDPVLRTRTFIDRFSKTMLVEVLAEGRQTVLPPSIHPDGMQYEWVGMPEWGFMCPTPLDARLPPALSQAVVNGIEVRLAELGLTKHRVERGKGLATGLADGERRRYEAFLSPKLREKVAAVREAPAGSRQDALNGAVYALAPWVREAFITEQWLEGEMRSACEVNGYIRDDGDKAFVRQIDKALDDGWNVELPDLDAGRAAQLMGNAPLALTSPTVSCSDGSLQPRKIDELLCAPAPVREWTVKGWIPHKQVTLIYGDGGTGKTTLLMQLCMVAAQGGRWFGNPVTRRKVLFVSAEDEMAELHFRFEQMAKLMGMGFPDLTVVSLADLEACELMMLDGSVLKPTGLFDALCGLVAAEGFDMVVLDPVADMFGGNEIDKRQVTKFMRTIRKRLAFDLGCSVVVAGHPSSDGLRRGTGESGSKAWSNSARARLFFTRGEDGETLTLEIMKANRAKLGDKLAMKWVEGVFVQVAPHAQAIISPELEAKIMVRLERENCVHKAGDRSPDWVGYAIGLELGEDLANPKGKQKVRQLMDEWEKAGYVEKLFKTGDGKNKQPYIKWLKYPGIATPTCP